MHANNFESTSQEQNPELEVVKELTKLIVGLNLVLWFKKHSIEGTPYIIISKLTFLFAQKRFFFCMRPMTVNFICYLQNIICWTLINTLKQNTSNQYFVSWSLIQFCYFLSMLSWKVGGFLFMFMLYARTLLSIQLFIKSTNWSEL